ncbi:DUF3696 domain-containing protein [Microbispora sp. ZYX-F-249]|uniref:DUF3696 domain-containing protein n=1 Tax=Microbispora maris TaxID=3144104 RepID=A0ABV0AN98_9ACTN
MITRLRIQNFKRFPELAIAMRPLTVLTGLNGTGKSTILQALLLARQVAERPQRGTVALNGVHGLALGEAEEVLHPDADEAVIDIGIDTATDSYRYRLAVPDDRSLNLRVVDPDAAAHPAVLSGRGSAFTYLMAERLGPRDQLAVTAEDMTDVGVGEQGQYVAQVLAVHDNDVIREPLRHPGTVDPPGVITLRAQVEAWAEEIIRPIRITAQWPPGLSLSVIRFQQPGLLRDDIRPANMGFGFSYALPVIVAGLLAGPGSLLIVENPEAHLHPAGQSRIGRFLARVAGAGAQVIVETHSDHVLNGIRLAAVEDRTVPVEQMLVHFFDGQGPAPASVEITPRGELTHWPMGFFDQMEEDLGRLARAKRR